jgi:hypothetical protein
LGEGKEQSRNSKRTNHVSLGSAKDRSRTAGKMGKGQAREESGLTVG